MGNPSTPPNIIKIVIRGMNCTGLIGALILFSFATVFGGAIEQLEDLTGTHIERPRRDRDGNERSPDRDRGDSWIQQRREAEQEQRLENARQLNLKGIEQYNKRDWRTAIEYFKKALRFSPDDQVIRQNLKNAEDWQRREAEQRRRLENARQLNLKGIEQYNKEYWSSAVNYFKEALKFSPDDQVIKKNLKNAEDRLAYEKQRQEFDEEKSRIVSNLKGTNSGKLRLKTGTEPELKKSDKVVEFHRILKDPNSRSKAIDAPITNGLNNRSPYEYSKVINQFLIRRVGSKNVPIVGKEEQEPMRYRAGEKTYCNIFVWDVTRAMGVEIPHWSREGKERHEVRANEMAELLRKHGRALGWKSVSADDAQKMANRGCPTIAIWQNPDYPKSDAAGHVAIVRPGSVGFPEGPAIAQAGRLVVNAEHLNEGFKRQWKKDKTKIEFWYHE